MDQTHIPLSDLMRAVIGSAGTLARAEIGLLRAEMQDKIKQGLTPLILAGAAAVLLLIGSLVFSLCLVLWLIYLDVAPHLAALAVAALFLLAGAAIMAAARAAFRRLDITPARTLAQLREDATILQGTTHG